MVDVFTHIVSIPELLQIIIQKEVYKSDYQEITENILEERIAYDVAVEALKQIIEEWNIGDDNL